MAKRQHRQTYRTHWRRELVDRETPRRSLPAGRPLQHATHAACTATSISRSACWRTTRQLAALYLDLMGGYIDHYSRLIGNYPYAKFAVVENRWQTGFGMPSFTLLGSRVLRLPFIPYTSLPHEILHNWWGNGVWIDYENGNWSEGLTAYLADHWMKERRGKGSQYRLKALQRYSNFAAEGPGHAPARFRQPAQRCQPVDRLQQVTDAVPHAAPCPGRCRIHRRPPAPVAASTATHASASGRWCEPSPARTRAWAARFLALAGERRRTAAATGAGGGLTLRTGIPAHWWSGRTRTRPLSSICRSRSPWRARNRPGYRRVRMNDCQNRL